MRDLLIVLGALLVIWLGAVATLFLVGRRVVARQLVRAVPDLLSLCRGLLRDPRVPRGSKILLGLAIVWVLSPIDLIPEFLPLIGPLDDVVVVLLVLRHVMSRAGEDTIREHWRGDPAMLRIMLRFAGARGERR